MHGTRLSKAQKRMAPCAVRITLPDDAIATSPCSAFPTTRRSSTGIVPFSEIVSMFFTRSSTALASLSGNESPLFKETIKTLLFCAVKVFGHQVKIVGR